jgi:TRAP-type C4-dicarboxylate transport system permease small subunit
MFVMMVLIFTQVVARYALNSSLTWSEEVGRYVFVWMSFLGIAAVYYKGSHISLNFLLDKLSGPYKKALKIFIDSLTIFLSCIIIMGGYRLVELGLRQRSAALRIPMNMVYIILPISGVLLLYFALRRFYATVRTSTAVEETAPKP